VEKIEQAVSILRQINQDANIITTHLDSLSREQILDAFQKGTFENDLLNETVHEHHHHGEHCGCGHHDHEHEHHHHGEHCGCGHHDHEHEHHHHGEHCGCGHHDHEHEHHHHGEHCGCGHHDHEHEHHHHADETFSSWGFETVRKYSQDEIQRILLALDSGDYGTILRAKGMVSSGDDWLYFDYVPEEHSVRSGSACFTGKICVIGANLDEEKLESLFSKNI